MMTAMKVELRQMGTTTRSSPCSSIANSRSRTLKHNKRPASNKDIADLEFAVYRKEAEVASTGNPLIPKDALKKLRGSNGTEGRNIEMARG